MTPHQREKEIEIWGKIVKPQTNGHIDTEKLITYLAEQEFRLDDLYKILTPSQRIEIEQHKTPL